MKATTEDYQKIEILQRLFRYPLETLKDIEKSFVPKNEKKQVFLKHKKYGIKSV